VTPEELLYAETHEWVHVETAPAGDKVATMGISALAVEQLGEAVYIGLPELGRRVKAGEPLVEIESVKAVSDIHSPVDGEVVEVNSQLAERPDRLAADPYEAGWLVRIRIDDESPLANLLDYATYRERGTGDEG
jgi:glycine cleavage system H protein